MLSLRRVQRFRNDATMYFVWITWEDEYAVCYPDGHCPDHAQRAAWVDRRHRIVTAIVHEDIRIVKCQRRKRFEVSARDELAAFTTVYNAAQKVLGTLVDIKV